MLPLYNQECCFFNFSSPGEGAAVHKLPLHIGLLLTNLRSHVVAEGWNQCAHSSSMLADSMCR